MIFTKRNLPLWKEAMVLAHEEEYPAIRDWVLKRIARFDPWWALSWTTRIGIEEIGKAMAKFAEQTRKAADEFARFASAWRRAAGEA